MSVMWVSRFMAVLRRCDRSPRPVSVGVNTLWPSRSAGRRRAASTSRRARRRARGQRSSRGVSAIKTSPLPLRACEPASVRVDGVGEPFEQEHTHRGYRAGGNRWSRRGTCRDRACRTAGKVLLSESVKLFCEAATALAISLPPPLLALSNRALQPRRPDRELARGAGGGILDEGVGLAGGGDAGSATISMHAAPEASFSAVALRQASIFWASA